MDALLLDLDSTIIEGYMDRADRDFDRVALLPGRAERLAAFARAGTRIAICSNQGAVAYGLASPEQVEAKIKRVAELLGFSTLHLIDGFNHTATSLGGDLGELSVYVAYGHERSRNPRYSDPAQAGRRKPSGAMLLEALGDLGVAPADALYVGDRPEDEAAAQAAGVPFRWEYQFFS